MFSVDRFVKCRMISGSASSGRAGRLVATEPAGSSSPIGLVGTSGAGNRAARREGLKAARKAVLQ